jgi:hypothetical protein
MTHQHGETQRETPAHEKALEDSETFKRHGPEPPENDSGPSPSVEEMSREIARPQARNTDRDGKAD